MELEETIRISFCHAMSVGLDASWGGRNYRDDQNRLYLASSGRGWVKVAGRKLVLEPGRTLLIPAGTVFDFGCTSPYRQHYIHFRASVLGGIPMFDLLPHRNAVDCSGMQAWRLAQHERMEAVCRDGTLAAKLECRGILLQLLAAFLTLADGDAGRLNDAGRFRSVLAYIEAHLDEAVPVPELADLAHLDRAHFTRSFTEAVGLPPGKYVTSRRIAFAQQLLRESPGATLERIARQTGFADAFHFSRVFRRVAGISPSEYRRQPRP